MYYWEIEEFEKSQNEFVVFLRRIHMTKHKRTKPSFIKECILKSSLTLMLNSYHNGTFGVISVQRNSYSLRRTFEMQFKITQRLKQIKQHSIAHIGFWEGLRHRCLFIPRIEYVQMKLLALEFHVQVYIWGGDSEWKCYKTNDDSILAIGNSHRIIETDFVFFIYNRIRLKEKHLDSLVRQNDQGTNNSRDNDRRQILNIRRQLNDLNRIKIDLFNGNLI